MVLSVARGSAATADQRLAASRNAMALRKRYEAQEAREPSSPGGSLRRDHERGGSGGAQEG
jgi:hypothetical protein